MCHISYVSCYETLNCTSTCTYYAVVVLCSVQSFCCVDKKGILSWPNPTAEKVFFIRYFLVVIIRCSLVRHSQVLVSRCCRVLVSRYHEVLVGPRHPVLVNRHEKYLLVVISRYLSGDIM